MSESVIATSDLPNDQDMIRALGSLALPMPLFTDACFVGSGRNKASILVCMERKKLGDICQCMNDGRLLNQLTVCKEAGADVMCVIVEGECRRNPEDGLLETPVWRANPKTGRRAEFWEPVRPLMAYSRFDQYLTELDYLAGVIVKRSRDVRETADIIQALYNNFQTPPDEHQSFHQMYSKASWGESTGAVELVRPSLVRRMAKEIDGVGWKRSGLAASRFLTVKAMVNAGVREWMSLDGIGRPAATRIVRDLGGGKKNER